MPDSIVSVKILGDAASLERAVSRSSNAFNELGKSAKGASSPVAGFSGIFSDQEKKAGSFSSSLTGLGSTLGGFVSVIGVAGAAAAASEFGKAIFQAGAEAERINLVLTEATGNSSGAANEFDFVRGVSQRLGIELIGAADGYAKIAASAKGTSLEGQGARDIFEGVANASARLGLSAADTSGVLLAIGQIMSKGTVQSEELKGQIGERLPGAFQRAAAAMGLTTIELQKMIESGRLLPAEFIPQLSKALKGVGDGTEIKTATAEVNRLSNAWTIFKQNIAESGFNDVAVGLIKGLTAPLNEVNTAFARSGKTAGTGWLEALILVAEGGIPIFGKRIAESARNSVDQFFGATLDDGSFARKEAARAKSQEAFKPSQRSAEFIELLEKEAGLTKTYETTLATLNAEYVRGGLSVEQYRSRVESLISTETAAGKAAVQAMKDRLSGYEKLQSALLQAIQTSAQEERAAKAAAQSLRTGDVAKANQTTQELLFAQEQKGRTPEEQQAALKAKANEALSDALIAQSKGQRLTASGQLEEAAVALEQARALAEKAQQLSASIDEKQAQSTGGLSGFGLSGPGGIAEAGGAITSIIESQAKLQDEKAAQAAATGLAQAQTLAKLDQQVAQLKVNLDSLGIKVGGIEEAKAEIASVLATIPQQVTTQWSLVQTGAVASGQAPSVTTAVNNLIQPTINQPSQSANGTFGTINLQIGDGGPYPVQTDQGTAADIQAALNKAALQQGRTR